MNLTFEKEQDERAVTISDVVDSVIDHLVRLLDSGQLSQVGDLCGIAWVDHAP